MTSSAARSAVLLLVVAATFTRAQDGYQGITRTTYTPGPSSIILVSDLPCRVTQGVRTFQSWTRPLSPFRFIVGTPDGLTAYLAAGGHTYTALQGADATRGVSCRETLPAHPRVSLRGLSAIRLEPVPYARQTDRNPGMFPEGILSTDENLSSLVHNLPEDVDASRFLERIRTGEALTWQGYTAIPNPRRVRMPAAGGRTVLGSTYLAEYRRQLELRGFAFEELILARSRNTIYPVVLTRYGTPQRAYAVYGVWHDEGVANRLGFRAKDRIFPTDQEVLPDMRGTGVDLERWPMFEEAPVDPAFRYGREAFTYEQIMANPAEYFPRLIWRAIPTWSDMPKSRDAEENLLPLADGNLPPTAPDDPNNDNPQPFLSCPDRDWYFGLYARCVELEMRTEDYELAHPRKYLDFKDYLQTKVMENYDATIYQSDKSVSSQSATTDNPPEQPFLFNKDGTLLNRDARTHADPWNPETRFYLQYRESYWEWGILHHRHQDRDLTDQARGAIGACVDLHARAQGDLRALLASGDVEVTWADETLKDSVLHVGNPIDYYNPYKNGNEFCNYDNNYVASGGIPFKTRSARSSGDDHSWSDVFNQEDTKDWYLQWAWTLVYQDRLGRKFSAGTIRMNRHFYHEENRLMASGQEEGGTKQNTHLTVRTPNLETADGDTYDKNSKDYHTDQHDVSDRNPKVDKGEAIATIARKIAVAEGLNFLVKALYAQSDNTFAAATYEATKRVENNIAVKKTYNLAMKAYQAYVLWAQTMDILAEVRDTYTSIGPAWDGLMSSLHNIYTYYHDLDFSSIRLTNITRLLPAQALYDLDWNVYNLQSSLVDFNLAIDALAFQTDRFTGGNYGPFNRYINLAYAELAQAMYTSGPEASRVITATTTALDAAKNASRSNGSDAAYLSNLTRATHNILVNQNLKVMNERNRSMAMALFVTQHEARQWIAFKNHMSNTYSRTPGAFEDARDQRSYMPVVSRYRDPGLFSDADSWAREEAAE